MKSLSPWFLMMNT